MSKKRILMIASIVFIIIFVILIHTIMMHNARMSYVEDNYENSEYTISEYYQSGSIQNNNLLTNEEVGIFNFNGPIGYEYLVAKIQDGNRYHIALFEYDTNAHSLDIKLVYNTSYEISDENAIINRRKSDITLSNIDVGVYAGEGEQFISSQIGYATGLTPTNNQKKKIGLYYEPTLSLKEANEKYAESIDRYPTNSLYWDKDTESELYFDLGRDRTTGLKYEESLEHFHIILYYDVAETNERSEWNAMNSRQIIITADINFNEKLYDTLKIEQDLIIE